eukprot:Pgem_evm2s18939
MVTYLIGIENDPVGFVVVFVVVVVVVVVIVHGVKTQRHYGAVVILAEGLRKHLVDVEVAKFEKY